MRSTVYKCETLRAFALDKTNGLLKNKELPPNVAVYAPRLAVFTYDFYY